MAALFQDLLNRRKEVGDGDLGRLLRDLQWRPKKTPCVAEPVIGPGYIGAEPIATHVAKN
jgi:hypothetical protein